MQIADKKAVAIEFTLKDEKGEVMETSIGRAPLWYLHGIGNLVPGLEKALAGKSAGDDIDVTLPPEEAYGLRDDKAVRNLPLRRFPGGKVQAGGRYQVQAEDGLRVVLVTAVNGDYAKVDGNHPLAGRILHFIVKVVEVRDATDDEQKHGHVHPPGGAHKHEHHHDHHDHHDHDHPHDHDHDH
jgi:FKBP-type peptidyl-prolyl cis-trans isomerase SlyD